MWVPPPWLIYSALHGAAYAGRGPTAVATGHTTKVVPCEECGRRYAYQIARTAYGAADRSSSGGYGVALQRAEAELQRLLASEVEAVPCPACGWYQSDMIPLARKQHRRWMIYAGQCLTVGLIPLAVFGLLINDGFPEAQALAPFFVPGLVCLFAVGIGMFIRRQQLAASFNPNQEDVGPRILYGRSRATLLSEQEAQDVPGQRLVRRPTGVKGDRGALLGCILAVICVAGLAGCVGFFGVRSLIRAHVVAGFEKHLPAYVALEGVKQGHLPQPGGVKGKMVVVNVNERKIDDLQFALPDDLCASKPEEVAAVVLLAWETSPTSREPLPLYGPSLYANRFIMIGHVKVFDWRRRSEIASSTFIGDVPEFDPDGKPMTGPKPEARVLAFLTGLSRQ
jgi:hypothetical protein